MMNLSYRKELWLHRLMCATGGFLGAYALLCRSENLGSAQTNNLIQVVLCLLGRNLPDFLLRVSGALLYVLAIVLYSIFSKKTTLNMKRYAITVDMIGIVFLAILPKELNPVAGILPIFFMMATQWSVFHGVGEYNSSTIFSTNNLRQFTLATCDYVMTGDQAARNKAGFFKISLIWYHIGVAVSFFACLYFHVHASLILLPLLGSAYAITLNPSLLPFSKGNALIKEAK